MTEKEKLLQLKSYEEFDRRREEFNELMPDEEIIEHLTKITQKSQNPDEELFKTPPGNGKRTMGR